MFNAFIFKTTNTFSSLHFNAGSLLIKVDEVECSVNTSEVIFDVLAFTETWFCNSDVHLDGFSCEYVNRP